MATKFQLKNFLSENREEVIGKFNELKEEQHYNGVSLKQFMLEVFNQMNQNNPRSDKKAASLLPFVMGDVYYNNSKVGGTEYTLSNGMMSEAAKRQLPSSMR